MVYKRLAGAEFFGEKTAYILVPRVFDIWDMGVSKNRETPQNGWFIMENPSKMDDLEVPPRKRPYGFGSSLRKQNHRKPPRWFRRRICVPSCLKKVDFQLAMLLEGT